jgi:ethanolamine utilization protein EutA
VAECLESPPADPFTYGDLGPWLAPAIAERARARGLQLHVASQAGRATSLGISRHGFLTSGGSLHAPRIEADPARYRNVPLHDEAAFAALHDVPATFAIELRERPPGKSEFADLVREAREWLEIFRRKKLTADHRALFLMRENLGKSFGYAVQTVSDGTTAEVDVLDEIRLEGQPSRVQTVDVGRPVRGRFLVTVKRLRLF